MSRARSVLYLPASNARAVEKARGLACDVAVLDLEDAVAPEMKAEARAIDLNGQWTATSRLSQETPQKVGWSASTTAPRLRIRSASTRFSTAWAAGSPMT